MPATNKDGTVIPLEKGKPNSKCRKWKLSVCLGRDPKTGRYINKQRRFSGTYTEAIEAKEAFVEELRSEQPQFEPPNKNCTYEEFVKLFIKVREASGDVASGTVRREEEKLNSLGHILNPYKMKDITPLVLDSAYADLRTGNSKSGKRLSGTYVSDIHKKVNIMMRYAKKVGLIKTNPCEDVEPPKEDTEEMRALPGNKVQKLVGALDPSARMECGVLLCITMGLRRGEAVGLSWEDIDFDARTIHVQHSYDDAGNLNSPKTKAGNRFLPMPDITYNALRTRMRAQMVQFVDYAPDLLLRDDEGVSVGVVPHAPVISDAYGNRIHPAGLGRWWGTHRAGYGLDGWKLHELRHTFLTIGAEKGVHPSILQKLAGHSTSRLTMDIYTHVNVGAQRQAVDVMQTAFTATA